jgi:hypothetical protein
MWALTHSATGLKFAYPLVLIPMIVGLIRGHASLFQYIQALWWALKITVMWVIILFLVSQFLHDMHVKEGVLQGCGRGRHNPEMLRRKAGKCAPTPPRSSTPIRRSG